MARCAKCRKEANAERYIKTADEHRARAARRRAENPDKGREYSKRWRALNPEKVAKYRDADYPVDKAKQRISKANYLATFNGRAKQLFGAAGGRAKKSGIAFSITLGWVISALVRGHCEQTGIKFVFGSEGRHPFSPSLDQIKPGEGYTPGNTQIVCNIYNNAKNKHEGLDVLTMARGLLQTDGYVVTARNPSVSKNLSDTMAVARHPSLALVDPLLNGPSVVERRSGPVDPHANVRRDDLGTKPTRSEAKTFQVRHNALSQRRNPPHVS